MNQRRSIAAVLSIIAAVVGFFSGPVAQFFLGLLAIGLGALGFLMAASPRVSGGMLSLVAIVLGVLAVALALIRGVLAILF